MVEFEVLEMNLGKFEGVVETWNEALNWFKQCLTTSTLTSTKYRLEDVDYRTNYINRSVSFEGELKLKFSMFKKELHITDIVEIFKVSNSEKFVVFEENTERGTSLKIFDNVEELIKYLMDFYSDEIKTILFICGVTFKI